MLNYYSIILMLNYYYYRKQSKSIECDEILTETFDCIMVCNGHNCYQAKPKIPGMEKFKGIQVHSGDYRTFHPFLGKQVVVVGCGNSGGLFKILRFQSHDFLLEIPISRWWSGKIKLD